MRLKRTEKNDYNVAKNSDGLIRTVVRQVKERAIHLPKGMKQKIQIDIRGQLVTKTTFNEIKKRIVERCNGALKEGDIKKIGDYSWKAEK